MKKSIIEKFILLGYIVIFTFTFLNIKPVHAATTFTTCTLSEGSYLRSEPGGTTLKDVDGKAFLLYEPKRLEVVETKTVGGKEYKKVNANYFSNNYTGWIYRGYLKDFKTFTTDDNYATQLRNSGFPETYILPLQKLHAVYPNWNFVAHKNGNGLDWNNVLNSEYSPVYRNLIDANDSSLLSTDGASYNAGVYKQFEPGWYAPSKQTIGFYMDPRNWLNDSTIFMFEQLSYNSKYHTENAVQQVLNGTFMSGSYSYNGSNITYAKTFMDAGSKNNVSPVHLASRVVKEQGSSGTSATINMQSDGQTYHNFFNINASGSTVSEIVSRALSTAKARGWTSPYTSIMGGASTISNGYINSGQDTIYYQKFNTINNNSLYSNQYMANVRVLPSEAYSIFRSYYNTNTISNSFTFKIPVYNNMPDATTLSTAQNGENALKSLSVTGCSLSPSFNSAATSYTCSVPSTTNSVTVNATKASSYSTMTGTGAVNLTNNSTKVSVVVTAANGNKKTYTITINKVTAGKETPADIISGIGYNNSNNMITGIDIGTNIANVISNVKNKYSLATISVKDKNGKAKTNGAVATGDVVTITNNGQTTTFTSVVKGDTNGDGNISVADYAKVKSYILKTSSLNNSYLKAADVNGDGKISVSDYAKIKSHILGTSKIVR